MQENPNNERKTQNFHIFPTSSSSSSSPSSTSYDSNHNSIVVMGGQHLFLPNPNLSLVNPNNYLTSSPPKLPNSSNLESNIINNSPHFPANPTIDLTHSPYSKDLLSNPNDSINPNNVLSNKSSKPFFSFTVYPNQIVHPLNDPMINPNNFSNSSSSSPSFRAQSNVSLMTKPSNNPFGINLSGSNSVVRNGISPSSSISRKSSSSSISSPHFISPIPSPNQLHASNLNPNSTPFSPLKNNQIVHSSAVVGGGGMAAALVNYSGIKNNAPVAAAPIKGTKITPKKSVFLQTSNSKSTSTVKPAAVRRAVAAQKKASGSNPAKKTPKNANGSGGAKASLAPPLRSVNFSSIESPNINKEVGVPRKPEVHVLSFVLKNLIMDAPPTFLPKLKFAIDFEDNLDLKRMLGKQSLPGSLLDRSFFGNSCDCNEEEYIRKVRNMTTCFSIFFGLNFFEVFWRNLTI